MVRIKLFYGKDFRALLLKYGRLDLAASLSGIEGQVGSPTAAVRTELPVPATPVSGELAVSGVGV